MGIKNIEVNEKVIAIIKSEEVIISDVQSGLDVVMSTGSDLVAIYKESICEEFFDLKTGIAGEVLQKFANYQVKFAIIGDFSTYGSKALRDFIYECNNGSSVFFVGTEKEAMERLAK